MEKNEISRAIKKKLVQNGLACIKVRGGTAWGWIDIDSDRDLTEIEQLKFKEAFGFEINRNGQYTARKEEWAAYLGFSESKNFTESEGYKNLKAKYFEMAQNLPDGGTCCGGSGTYIFKDGKRIDFWKNTFAQSEDPIVTTERELARDFISLGLEIKHESGWMD